MAAPAPDRPEAIFTSSDEDRRRRPADVVDLAAALLLVVAGLLLDDATTGLGQAVEQVLRSLPAWGVSLLDAGFVVGGVTAGVLAVLVVVRRRPVHLGRDLLVAAGLAAAVATWWADADVRSLAMFTAIVVVAVPQLVRPCRRLGHALVAVGLASTVASGAATLPEAIAALGVGIAAAALVHVVFGSPAGAPSVYRVESALDRAGITVAGIAARPGGHHGVLVLDATTPQGSPLTVNAFGRDATDTQLLRRLWRFLWYRDTSNRLMLSRDEQIEHEALLTVLAGRAGVRTADVVAITRTSSGDGVLVLRPPWAQAGGPLSEAQVDEAWRQLATAHSAELIHGHLSVGTVAPGPDDQVALLDWSAGGLHTRVDRRHADGAALLAVTAVSVGTDAAADAAKRHLTDDELTAVLPFIQRPAFTAALRGEVRAAGVDVDELRSRTAAAAGVDLPELVKLRRVTVKGLATTGLALVAAYFLISSVADIGIDTVIDALSQATLGFVLAALLLGQAPRVAQAVGTIGATSQPLALGPTVGLQFAVTFVNLAVPSTAARVALEMRYYQKQGVGRTEAVTAGSISAVAGFVVQIVLLVVTFALAGSSLDLQLEGDVGSTVVRLAGLVVAAAAVALLVVLVVPFLRRHLAPVAHQIRAAFAGILNPRHLGLLFGGNLAGEILFSLTLGLCVRALGYDLDLAQLVLINEMVAIFAGIMPIPGGIGVTEGALTAGLIAFGIPEAPAFAAVLLYRMVTFYLPPLWGYLSLRWLQRNSYL